MPENEHHDEPPSGVQRQLFIVLVVVALIAVTLIAKTLVTSPGTAPSEKTAAASITSTRNDALADYDASIKAGKPIYILFHSLTCEPCVEISAVADQVIPGYEGRVSFVNAITDSPSGRQLSSRFAFQYIPTSIFIAADGTVIDSFTGVLSADEMKSRLDTLVGE